MIKSRRKRSAGHVAHMGRAEVQAGFWWGNLGEREHSEDLCIDGKMILKWFFKKWFGIIDWIDLTHDRDSWRVLVITVMKILFP